MEEALVSVVNSIVARLVVGDRVRVGALLRVQKKSSESAIALFVLFLFCILTLFGIYFYFYSITLFKPTYLLSILRALS